MTQAKRARDCVFISYSHRDADWVERIRVHLAPFEREHEIKVWDDSRIRSGDRWLEEIRSAIDSTRVAVLVISADFLASDFIANQELPALLRAAEEDGAVILPLIVSPSRFESTTGLGSFQAVNDPKKPLIKLSKGDQEETLVKLAGEIESALRLETDMRQYLSPAVIADLRQSPGRLPLSPEKKELTILHSDVRGFTALAENLGPEQVGRYLHRYLTFMTEIVFASNGTLDRYVGNALTAYWGAPIEYADAAARACDAALDMVRKVAELNPMLRELGMPPLRLNIAITTGFAIVGSMGSAQRFQYTIIGEILQILPRLVYLNNQFGADILITQSTHQLVRDSFQTRTLADQIVIKGKSQPLSVYELLGRRDG
ncbi:MAG TPA: adenylate/guanylate cyclase domain-containing protein [Bryobacteraceae bacterium]|jgi:class 3 adenylate cyclase|nr:adenylate/guanylate cyclase domain-containing protein [Bryobacteraceae bacterium]